MSGGNSGFFYWGVWEPRSHCIPSRLGRSVQTLSSLKSGLVAPTHMIPDQKIVTNPTLQKMTHSIISNLGPEIFDNTLFIIILFFISTRLQYQ
jgi:hypothetical protein